VPNTIAVFTRSVTQDGLYRLHFDLRVTRVGEYNEETLVPKLVDELVKAAKSFEDEADRYVVSVSMELTSDAIMLLNIYGRLYKNWPVAGQQPAIFQSAAATVEPIFKDEVGRVLFQQAALNYIHMVYFGRTTNPMQ